MSVLAALSHSALNTLCRFSNKFFCTPVYHPHLQGNTPLSSPRITLNLMSFLGLWEPNHVSIIIRGSESGVPLHAVEERLMGFYASVAFVHSQYWSCSRGKTAWLHVFHRLLFRLSQFLCPTGTQMCAVAWLFLYYVGSCNCCVFLWCVACQY